MATNSALFGLSPRARQKLALGLCTGLLGALLFSCTSDSSPSNSDPEDNYTPGDPTILVGTFQVRLVAPVAATATEAGTPGYTSILGKVYDGSTPSQIIWEEGAPDGDCSLFTPRVPFCTESCGGSAVCVEDNQCQDYPTAQTVGIVLVEGIHTGSDATSFSLEPVAKSYQPAADISLPYPAFSEGEAIIFTAPGSDFTPAFILQAQGISPLAVNNSSISLATGQPLDLTWTAPGEAGNSRIHVKLDISHHGGSKGKIECDAEDTGALEVSAALIDQLLALGVSGFPTIVITRSTTGSATISAGRVDLIVSSEVEMAVEIPGVTSCTGDEDCPTGETCQTDLVCK